MSILTFNASTSNRKKLSMIKCPFQIMPGGRSALSSADVERFIKTENPDILIHSSYITRPFGKSGPVTEMNLENYVKLGERIGTKNILVHLPASKEEYKNYEVGLGLLIELVIKKGFNIHFEIPAFSKDLRQELLLCLEELSPTKKDRCIKEIIDIGRLGTSSRKDFLPDIQLKCDKDETSIEKLKEHLEIGGKKFNENDPKTYQEISYLILCNFIDEIFDLIPLKFQSYFKFVPDTAHLFANGIDGKLQVKLIERYKDRIEFVHLNGNLSPMMSKTDKHVPIYEPTNQIQETEELSTYLGKSKFICVTENSTVKGEYTEWKRYAKNYGFDLVPENSLFSM